MNDEKQAAPQREPNGAPQPSTLLDRSDVRVKHATGIGGTVSAFVERVRSGDLGSLPVVAGLIIIWTVFTTLNPVFLSADNLVNLLFNHLGSAQRKNAFVSAPTRSIPVAYLDAFEDGDSIIDGKIVERDGNEVTVERPAHCNPRSGGSNPQRESQHQMGPAGDALGVGIEQEYGESDRRKQQGEPIQLAGRQNENRAGDNYEGNDKSRREIPGRQSA